MSAQEMTLVHKGRTYSTSKITALQKLEKFMRDPGLLGAPYDVKLPVSAESFECFVKALNDEEYKITANYIDDLTTLCDFFGFASLQAAIDEFCSNPEYKEHETEKRIMDLETQVHSLQEVVESFASEMRAMRESHAAEVRSYQERLLDLEKSRDNVAKALDSLHNEICNNKPEFDSHDLKAELENPSSLLFSKRVCFQPR